MTHYTLEQYQRNLHPTLKKQFKSMGRPTVLIRFGVGWGVDSLNVQKIGRWARAAQPGFLLMFNAELWSCELYIVCQNLAPRNAYQYNASIKETIAISVKYYTVFPFSFVHCLIGEFSPSSFWNTEAIWPSLKTTEHTVGTQHSWSCWTMLYERPNLPLPCYMNQNDLC